MATDTAPPDLYADPFQERVRMSARRRFDLLGARVQFESNSPELMRLVESAYAGLPHMRLTSGAPYLTVRLWLAPSVPPRTRGAASGEPLRMCSVPHTLLAAPADASAVVVSARERSALVTVAARLLADPYHTRYELIEFAVFTLAARAQRLISLHAACVGRDGRAVLLMGPSGAGKSTAALHALLAGLDFVAEDSVFVAPARLLAMGVANFLHVRPDALRFLDAARRAHLARAPRIRRRSGVEKLELDLRRQSNVRLARAPLTLVALVFLSAARARRGSLLKPLGRSVCRRRLRREQAYAVRQPGWADFERRVLALQGFELRRGSHPREAAGALAELLGAPPARAWA